MSPKLHFEAMQGDKHAQGLQNIQKVYFKLSLASGLSGASVWSFRAQTCHPSSTIAWFYLPACW